MTREISVHDVDPHLPIVDVREPNEWAAGHIDGAIHLPLGEVTERAGELPEGELQVVCRGGVRSLKAAEWLNANGYEATNVAGGMAAWAQAGLPMISDGNDTPQVV